MLIVILCQGVLPDRGVHLPWGPTRWQRSGHSVRRSCARLPFATQVWGGGALPADDTPEYGGGGALPLCRSGCGLTTDVRQGLP